MNIQEKLLEKFGKDYIKISFAADQFNLQQTGVDFYSSKLPKKDFQWYLYENGMGMESISSFNKNEKQSFAWLIALCYSHGELGSKFPTHLICVSGARSSEEKNQDGTFDAVVYTLIENQTKEILKEYEEISTGEESEKETPTVIDLLREYQNLLDVEAQIKDLTYDQVCKNLKFYCGWNPKEEGKIKEEIASGLPQLKNVEVKVRGFYVKITFSMPDGTRKKYEYR